MKSGQGNVREPRRKLKGYLTLGAPKNPILHLFEGESKLNAIKLNAAQRLPDDVSKGRDGKGGGKSGKLRQSESFGHTCGEFLSNLHNNYRASAAELRKAQENPAK